jgi:hypothetical protein
MAFIRCAECGEEHDLSGLEPTYWRPDAFLALSESERDARAKHTKDYCIIYSAEASGMPRCFVRGVLPVVIRGESKNLCWGLWVEMLPAQFDRVWQLWDDPDQNQEPPLACWIANQIERYPNTLGLPSSLQLESAGGRPTIRLAPGLEHPFAREVADGVDLPRSLEWRAWHLH